MKGLRTRTVPNTPELGQTKGRNGLGTLESGGQQVETISRSSGGSVSKTQTDIQPMPEWEWVAHLLLLFRGC